MYEIGIIGAGKFGQALNFGLQQNSGLEGKIAITSRTKRDIPNFVSNEEVFESKYLILAQSAQTIGDYLEDNKRYLRDDHIAIIAAKGIDSNRNDFLSNILLDYFPKENITCLVGPAFANEIMSGKTTRLHIAGNSTKTAKKVADLFPKELRGSYSKNILTFDIANAYKNVIAIGSGICQGVNSSKSTQFSFIAQGHDEMARFVKYFGGSKKMCKSNHAICADLYMTASEQESRNFRFGKMIGEGIGKDEAIRKIGETVEGVRTITAIMNLRRKYPNLKQVLPITRTINALIHSNGKYDANKAQEDLLRITFKKR